MKITKQYLDKTVAELIKRREMFKPYVQKFMDEMIPVARQCKQTAKIYTNKSIEKYNVEALPQIIKYKKVMLMLFHIYSLTSAYRLTRNKPEWVAKISKIIR